MDKKRMPARTKTMTDPPAHTPGPTLPIEEGPYYLPGSPERTRTFEAGVPGEKLILSGFVFDLKGRPISHAWMDFWQANGHGRYDINGYGLRGHQYTDQNGKYVLETVMPGGYASRTPHIHVKVRADNKSPILTTQLFFPGVATNETDFLFREETLVSLKETPGGKAATFNFVLG
jgi:protocatechuate 3,4-dioxygenase beta subunit